MRLIRWLSKKVKETPYYPVSSASDIRKIRNIGIIAHIDSGKTTLTERLLYYSGALARPGNVDDGTTTMDYLLQERQRGITIRAAATTFKYSEFHLNLIDTPGHIDFSGEVQRALRVMDGAVVVIDANNGIQPQTEKVWKQSEKFQLPRIVFVNKLDLFESTTDLAVDQIKKKLNSVPLVLQVPFSSQSSLHGFYDLISKKLVKYLDLEGNKVEVVDDLNKVQKELVEKEQYELFQNLSLLDDDFAEKYLSGQFDINDVNLAIRKCTILLKGVPVLCGSALKNRNIQPVLEGIIQYLPSPDQTPPQTGYIGSIPISRSAKDKKLCALAYKVVSNSPKGPLVYVRIYSGKIKHGMQLKNTSQYGKHEKANRILRVRANEYVQTDFITAGDIVALGGLREVKSGDTLIQRKDSQQLVLPGVQMPPPVFFCTIETQHDGQDQKLNEFLENMCREDPSISAIVNEETNQMVISGQGELQLEILRDRLQTEYKLQTRLGPIQVAYRQSVKKEGYFTLKYQEQNQYFSLTLKVTPEQHVLSDQEDIRTSRFEKLHATSEWKLVNIENSQIETFYSKIDKKLQQEFFPIHKISASSRQEILKQINFCSKRGPEGYPLINLKVTVVDGIFRKTLTQIILKQVVTKCFRHLIKSNSPVMLQPIMEIDLDTTDQFLGGFLSDLNSRSAQVLQVLKPTPTSSTIKALVPLKKILGYTSRLRSLSKGTATSVLNFNSYAPIINENQTKILINLEILV